MGENKAPANNLKQLGQLDYMGKLSSQLEWQKGAGDRPIRVVGSSSGVPTAALVTDDGVLVNYTLLWIACMDGNEADSLLAVININALYEFVKSLVPKGQFGARHLQKHSWKLAIPKFDPSEELHSAIAEAGARAATSAGKKLADVEKARRQDDRYYR